MESKSAPKGVLHSGDRDGLGVVYDSAGQLLILPGEASIATLANWDLDIISPWRRVVPKTIFAGFHGKASSRLYVTSARMVLIRDIDEWRELSEQLTPLGLPSAAAREAELKNLKSLGSRQFCEIFPANLRTVSAKRYRKHLSMLDLRLIGNDGRQYGIMFWKTDGKDEPAIALIESRFRH